MGLEKDFLIDVVKSRFKKPDKIDKDIHPDCLIIDSTDGKILVEDLIELILGQLKYFERGRKNFINK